MPMTISTMTLIAALASGVPADPTSLPQNQPEKADRQPEQTISPAAIERVGGEPEAEVVRNGEFFRAGIVFTDAPLPEGYPRPTPPGAIEIKTYPSVRRAEFRVDRPTGADTGMNLAFFPLFQHIQRRDIAMTSPVEMDYDPSMFRDMADKLEIPDDAPEVGGWVMSFLYRTPDLGPVGEDGRVMVVDTPPVTVLSLGYRGQYGSREVSKGLEVLTDWLDGNPQWEIAGPPRAFYYNGPNVRPANRWGEIQLPIRAAAPATVGVD